jgi:cation diffusion facilitator family transporter
MDKQQRKKISQKTTLIGAVIDFILAVFKIISGVLGGSGALIADGLHSFSDLLSDAMVLYATKYASAEADKEHPYGHERFETLATLGLSVILALVSVGITWGAIERFFTPTPLSHSVLLMSVAALSILSKEILYWYTLKAAHLIKSDLLKANAWHHRTDSLSSVVVLIGIIGALNGYVYLDALAAIVVGIMVMSIAWKLGLDAIKELVDTSINTQDVENLTHVINQISGVNSVHSLRTRKIGHLISADVHVQVDPFLSVSEGHIISVSVERVAKKYLKDLSDVTVHIDPENDEIHPPYEHLPERAQALGILNKALFANNCDGEITHIILHYLEGKIHTDFYLPIACLKGETHDNETLERLQNTVKKLPEFGRVRVFFGHN